MPPQNIFECATCGTNLGNGSLLIAVNVTDIDPATGSVVHYYFCRDREEPGPTEKDKSTKVKGCSSKIVSTTTLKYLRSVTSGG